MDNNQTPLWLPADLAGGPFLHSQARARGVPRHRLHSDALRHPSRSVYVPSSVPESRELKAKMWMLALPGDTALFGLTAAEWYELPAPRSDDVHIIVPAGVVPVRRPGLVPHEGLGVDDSRRLRDIRVTTPARTFLDLAQGLRRDQLVILGDDMVRQELITPDELRSATATAHRKRGVVLARQAAGLVRAGVDLLPDVRRERVGVVAGERVGV